MRENEQVQGRWALAPPHSAAGIGHKARQTRARKWTLSAVGPQNHTAKGVEVERGREQELQLGIVTAEQSVHHLCFTLQGSGYS